MKILIFLFTLLVGASCTNKGAVDRTPDTETFDTGVAASATPDDDGDGYTDDEDCDDTDPAVNPGATEICDNVDNDCNSLIDDADPDLDLSTGTTWYADTDRDGYGQGTDRPTSTTTACDQPGGYVADNTDCYDNDPGNFPGATEACDGIDNDCDGVVDEGFTYYYATLDEDGDGWGGNADAASGCPGTKPPDYSENVGDCDDTDPTVNPEATEICNNIDDDCDTLIDEEEICVP